MAEISSCLSHRPDQELARIIASMMRGAKDREIAAELHLGLRTVERRVCATMTRYGLQNRFQLGALAIHLGWLDSTELTACIAFPESAECDGDDLKIIP